MSNFSPLNSPILLILLEGPSKTPSKHPIHKLYPTLILKDLLWHSLILKDLFIWSKPLLNLS